MNDAQSCRLLRTIRFLGAVSLLVPLLLSAQNDVLQEPPGAPAVAAPPQDDFGFDEIEMFAHVIELIRQNYHDESRVSYEQLISKALEGMLASLDPHCQFMGREVFDQMKQQTGGTYDGVGITIALRNDVLTIVSVREDGPAARGGVLPGDQIRKINEFLADKIGLSEAMQLMRGQPGQPLKLTLHRPANNQLFEVELVREVIRESTVVDAGLLPERYAGDRKIGYLRLTQFSAPTVKEMVDALDDLEGRGMEALVMDLRNNPGGLLSSAVNTCGEFLPANTLVLTTEGREAVANTKEFRTPTRKNRVRSYPLAVLVNNSSASGAEVVSGALQDLRRAVIVGETTFGKGSVQSIIPIPSSGGSAVRLTTARYYTPSKRTIHENGVIPNIVSTLTPEDELNLLRWFRRETLAQADREKIERWQDRQLARAVDAIKGALLFAELHGFSKPPMGEGQTPAPAAAAQPAKPATAVPAPATPAKPATAPASAPPAKPAATPAPTPTPGAAPPPTAAPKPTTAPAPEPAAKPAPALPAPSTPPASSPPPSAQPAPEPARPQTPPALLPDPKPGPPAPKH